MDGSVWASTVEGRLEGLSGGMGLAPQHTSILLSQVERCGRDFGRTLSLAASVDLSQKLLCPIQPFLFTASALCFWRVSLQPIVVFALCRIQEVF